MLNIKNFYYEKIVIIKTLHFFCSFQFYYNFVLSNHKYGLYAQSRKIGGV